MTKTVIFKLAASALVLGGVAVGCKPAAHHIASASGVTPKAQKAAAGAAEDATEALKDRKFAKAIVAAEKAVGLAPDNAGHRALLGQAYLQAGRFASAESSLQDAVRLDPAQPRAALSLALAQIAQGKSDDARTTLARARGVVPNADAGLALALAGDFEGAVAMLEPAARVTGADAKTRQNLALAYALAGRWQDAQVTAAQDVPPDQMAERLQKWASFARPRTSSDQVSALLGVVPVADPGMPAQLALVEQPVQVAVAEPVLPAAPQVETAAADVIQPEAVSQASYVPAEVPAVAPEVQPATYVQTSTGGRYVVQLGAYSTANRAEIAWNRKVDRVRTLAEYPPASSTVRRQAAIMHRLAVVGFATRGEALKVCAQVKARGADCFVRVKAGDTPVQWVSRRGASYASR